MAERVLMMIKNARHGGVTGPAVRRRVRGGGGGGGPPPPWRRGAAPRRRGGRGSRASASGCRPPMPPPAEGFPLPPRSTGARRRWTRVGRSRPSTAGAGSRRGRTRRAWTSLATRREARIGCGGTRRPSGRHCWRGRGWGRRRRCRGTRRRPRRRCRTEACGERGGKGRQGVRSVRKRRRPQKTVRTTTLTRARGRKKKRTVGWGPRAIARPPAPRVVPNATRASEARENRAVERARAPEHLALVRSERADVVGRLVDGDEQVPRVLPLVLAARSRRAGRRARASCPRPRRAAPFCVRPCFPNR